MEILHWLQKWYINMCDGQWEHTYGIKIYTSDNPGWIVEIDLVDTPFENKPFSSVHNYIDDHNYEHCQVKNGKFQASGDASKLDEILTVFRNWIESL